MKADTKCKYLRGHQGVAKGEVVSYRLGIAKTLASFGIVEIIDEVHAKTNVKPKRTSGGAGGRKGASTRKRKPSRRSAKPADGSGDGKAGA